LFENTRGRVLRQQSGRRKAAVNHVAGIGTLDLKGLRPSTAQE